MIKRLKKTTMTSRSIYFMQKLKYDTCTQSAHITYAGQYQETTAVF